MQAIPKNDLKIAINRFASSFSAAFRAFHLYRQNNKALDEIMDNLVGRAKEVSETTFKLGLTNRSLVYDGESVGDREITHHLAFQLRVLGIKEIIFHPPLFGRHFFQILNIVTSQDPLEVKIEKLIPFLGDEDSKPISFVPITSNSILLRLPDDLLEEKLAPFGRPVAENGTGLIEEMMQHPPTSLGDLYTQIAVRSEGVEKSLRIFVRNLIDALREGYFPFDRFLKVFPLPDALKKNLMENLMNAHQAIVRKPTSLGLACHPQKKSAAFQQCRWEDYLVAFSKEEIRHRHDLTIFGTQQQGSAELELAFTLLKDTGTNFNLGLKILIHVLNQQNQTSIQEKALKTGLATWLQFNKSTDDMVLLSQLSALRQSLALPHNITLALFPIRTLSMETELFQKLSAYLITLGDVIIPSLIQSLDAEEDRGMRKKLCQILTTAVREHGTGFLIKALESAPPFLLRNLVMILGDVRSQEALQNLSELTNHSQKIVRIEAYRSLGKIGSAESSKQLIRVLEKNISMDEKMVALEQVVARRDRDALEPLIRLVRHEQEPSPWKNELIKSIGGLGGPTAMVFFQSLNQKGSTFFNFNPHAKDEHAIVQNFLKQMGL